MCICKNAFIVIPFVLSVSGGRYQLEIKIPETYPFNPPKVEMNLYFLSSLVSIFFLYLCLFSVSFPFLICEGEFVNLMQFFFSGAIYDKDLASQH